MSTVVKRYKLLRELPNYAPGTVFTHEYEILPSKFNDGTYTTDGEYYTEERGHKVHAVLYIPPFIDRCLHDYNIDSSGWFEEVA